MRGANTFLKYKYNSRIWNILHDRFPSVFQTFSTNKRWWRLRASFLLWKAHPRALPRAPAKGHVATHSFHFDFLLARGPCGWFGGGAYLWWLVGSLMLSSCLVLRCNSGGMFFFFCNFDLSLPINIWICNLEESYELAVRKNHTNLMDCIHMKSY